MDGWHKKYVPNSIATDFYRTTNTRPTNEYASYSNTLSRQSFFGNYPCTKYKYSYPSDVSLSTYGHTSWGFWRDTGHLSASTCSTKKRINIRSFSILIVAAVFIVLLAILSIAAFAFYFNTIKSELGEAVLVFDCSMQIEKGDTWTPQLKYNHTTAFRQKAAFYKKYIETSLANGNFKVARTEINNFGEGLSSIVLSFRVYLDMRQIQITITNVEELIRNSLISEISTFRNLKINEDSIEIKRQLDPEALQQAALIKDEFTLVVQEDFTELNQKILTSTDKLKKESVIPKFSIKKDPQKVSHESEIDTDNLPVIQGSFEITKTDADITQKRTNVRPTTTLSIASSTMKINSLSPTIKINNPKVNVTNDEILEKFWQHQKKINEIKTSNITNSKEKPFASKIFNTTLEMSDIKKNELKVGHETSNKQTNAIRIKTDEEFPKLDTNLFTTAPVIDNQPWLPINPATTHSTTEVNLEISHHTPIPLRTTENLMYRNKASDSIISSLHNSTIQNDSVLYQSFYNTDFSGSSLEVEKLGQTDVKPYPLPINKIDFSEESDVKKFEPIEKEDFEKSYDKEKFEHLGGGVVAKKTDLNDTLSQDDYEEATEIDITTTTDIYPTFYHEKSTTQNQLSTSTEKLNFLNMKDFIVNKMQNISNIAQTHKESTEKPFNSTNLSMNNNTNSEPQLFPSITKWEFVNGTRLNHELNITKKVFNETLQAVVVENFQTSSSNSRAGENKKLNQTEKEANLQQLSSIFDTLASKLGLNPDITSKIPPFSPQSQNKLKQNNKIKLVPDNITINSQVLSTTTSKTTENIKDTLMGQAEVEAVEYDEIFSLGSSSALMHSSTVPSLVTLMPVKSNSAIRLFKPPLKKNYEIESKNSETVVKTSVLFDS